MTKELRILMTNASSPKYLAAMYYKRINVKNNMKLFGFEHNEIFNYYHSISILNKIIFRLFPHIIYKKISNDFYEYVLLCKLF